MKSWIAGLVVSNGFINNDFLKVSKSISNTEISSSSDPDSSSSHSSIIIPENGVGVWKTLKVIDPVLSKGWETPIVLVNLISIFWLVRFISVGKTELVTEMPLAST